MSLPRYPRYKDTGVAWLGQVPEHWGVMRLKEVTTLIESGVSVNAIDTPAGKDESGVLKTSCVYGGDFSPSENKSVIPEELGRLACPVKAGTLIVSRMNTPDLVGAAGLVRQSCVNLYLPDRLWQIHFKNACPAFIHYWTQTRSYRAQVESACAGTSSSMQNLSQDEFRCFVLTLPSTIEQSTIAAFLDRETGKIDALISEQEKLLALVAEKRQATISHAVTCGLNPDAPMKDSGVAWLGKLPAHWDVLKGSRIGELFGSEPIPDDDVREEGQLPFLKVGSLSLRGFEVESWDWYVDEAVAARCSPRRGFIVFPKRGAAIFTNKVNIVNCDALIDPNLMGWQIGRRALVTFIAYVLKTRKLQELADVSTVPQINNKHIGPEKFPVPPLSEQSMIVDFLDAETAKLDNLRAEAERAIDLLKERRSALIAAAVTGKIDVRNVVPQELAA